MCEVDIVRRQRGLSQKSARERFCPMDHWLETSRTHIAPELWMRPARCPLRIKVEPAMQYVTHIALAGWFAVGTAAALAAAPPDEIGVLTCTVGSQAKRGPRKLGRSC